MRALRMPLRFVRGGVVRLVLTVLALACGVALVCAIDLANRAVYVAFGDVLDTMAGRAALQVTAGNGALFDEAVAETVAGVPGVELAVPVVSSWAFTTDGTPEQLTVHGIDVTNDDAIRTYEPSGDAAIDDPLVFLAKRDSVMLTHAFAERRGLRLDDPIELDTPTGRQGFVVRGLLAPTGIARVQGGNLLVMDIQAAERAFARPGLVNRVDVVLERDVDRSDVAAAITGVVQPGLRVEFPEQRRLDLHKVIRSIQILLHAVSVFGLFAAFLIAFSRLSTVFESRVAQLAVLRAVGVRARRVWFELLKESLVVALAGIGLGIPAGIALGHAILPLIETATSIGAKLVAADATIAIRPESIATASLLGLAAVLLAAVVPARRAAAVPVAHTLRYRQLEADRDQNAVHRGIGIVGSAALLAVALHVHTRHPGIGLVASALVVATAALAARSSLARLARVFHGSAPPVGGAIGRYAVAGLLRAPRRTALTVATLGVGFGTVLWLWTLAGSFERSVVEVMPGVIRGDLVVSSANVAAGYIEAPLDEAVLADIAATPGVAAVVGEQTGDWHHADGPIALNAFDPIYFSTTTFGHWRLTGRALPGALEAVARGDGVIVSENFVHNLGEGVGRSLTLETPTGPVTLRIVATTADFLSPRGTVLLSRALYREKWRDGHITRALLTVDDPAILGAVRTSLLERLGARHRVRVLEPAEVVAWFAAQARSAFRSLDVLGALVLVVVLVGVGDALAASALERTRELGVLRAMGLRRGRIRGMLLVESVVVGVLGTVAAVALGVGLGVLWVTVTFPSLIGWTLTLHLPLRHVLEVALAAVGVCLLAAYGPAVRAARLDPVVALRTE